MNRPNEAQISAIIAEVIREIATRKANVPVDTGELKKSHVVNIRGNQAIISVNTPYAAAVHQGRRQVVIRPKKAKRLSFTIGSRRVFAKKVVQPPRKGKPWLKDAANALPNDARAMAQLNNALGAELLKAIKLDFRNQRIQVN